MVAGGGVQDVLVGLLTRFAPSILGWIAVGHGESLVIWL